MAAYLNGQPQSAYLNGQPQAAYLNGQLVMGAAVLLDLFTENHNNGTVEWTGYNGYLPDPIPNFGSLNPDEVEGKLIQGVLISEILATGVLRNWFAGPLGQRLLRELGPEVHVFGPGYDQVWHLDELNTFSSDTEYRYIPNTPEAILPNNTLLTVQLGFKQFNVINVMTAGTVGNLIGYSIDDGIGSMSPDFVNGAQVTAAVIDTGANTYTVRVAAVVNEDWWNKQHVNGTDVGMTHLSDVWSFSTGPGFSQWERTGFLPDFVDGEVYDIIFDQYPPITNDMTAGNQAGAIGYIRGFVGTLTPDTLFGTDVDSIIDNPTQDVFAITLEEVEPSDFWESVTIVGQGVNITLYSSGMTYEEDGDVSVWSTPGLLGLQDGDDYEFRFV